MGSVLGDKTRSIKGSQNDPPLEAKMASQCILRLTVHCAQAVLRYVQEYSPSALVKAAATHVKIVK
jgi:hypothetical protein